jgi:hypothetical protein
MSSTCATLVAVLRQTTIPKVLKETQRLVSWCRENYKVE